MQTAAHIQRPSSESDLKRFELAEHPSTEPVGTNPAWRKLLVQAEMVASHVQVASIEGESGSGKKTLARYLHSRSVLTESAFQCRDARAWLGLDTHPAALSGFLYLDRVDLLAPREQGLLLSVLRVLQDRPPSRAMLIASSERSLRHMAGQGMLLPDLAYRLTAVRFAVPPLRQRQEDIAPWHRGSWIASARATNAAALCSSRKYCPACCNMTGPEM